MKHLIIIWSLIYSSFTFAFPPVGAVGQNGATTLYPVVNKTPYNQVTNLGAGKALIETGSENQLINPNFEASTLGSAWVNVAGVASVTSTAGEFSSGLQAAKIALTAQALSFSQSVSTSSGQQSQAVVGLLYKVPSAVTDFQVCSLIAGAESTCVPSANLIADNLYHSIEIPAVITPGSTVGIKAKTTATYTQNIFIDAAYVKQGIGTQNLMTDTEYRAQISAACVVTSQDHQFLATPGTLSATSQCAMVFTTGIFTTAPNCTMTLNNPANTVGASIVFLVVPTATGFTSYTTQDGVAAAAKGYTISCKKSGNDYLNSSANVYSQSSGNYDWTSYTPTFTGLGTVTSLSCKHRRVGGDLEGTCTFVTGTTTATLFSMTLPNSLIIDSSKISVSNTTAASGQAVGTTAGNGALNYSLTVSYTHLTLPTNREV